MMPSQYSGPHSQWEQTQVPITQSAPFIGATVPDMTLEGQQNAVQNIRPVNIQHLIHWRWIDIVCKLWQ